MDENAMSFHTNNEICFKYKKYDCENWEKKVRLFLATINKTHNYKNKSILLIQLHKYILQCFDTIETTSDGIKVLRSMRDKYTDYLNDITKNVTVYLNMDQKYLDQFTEIGSELIPKINKSIEEYNQILEQERLEREQSEDNGSDDESEDDDPGYLPRRRNESDQEYNRRLRANRRR